MAMRITELVNSTLREELGAGGELTEAQVGRPCCDVCRSLECLKMV